MEDKEQVTKDEITEEEKSELKEDAQVILDDRGYYSMNDGKWLIKVRRLTLREVMSGWNVIYPVFGGRELKGVDLNEPDSWLQMFAIAASTNPGVFYNFLILLLEPLYKSHPHDKQNYKQEVEEFHEYVRRRLMPEEMRDIIYICFKQEEKRFMELVNSVKKMFAPQIKLMMGQTKEENKKV